MRARQPSMSEAAAKATMKLRFAPVSGSRNVVAPHTTSTSPVAEVTTHGVTVGAATTVVCEMADDGTFGGPGIGGGIVVDVVEVVVGDVGVGELVVGNAQLGTVKTIGGFPSPSTVVT